MSENVDEVDHTLKIAIICFIIVINNIFKVKTVHSVTRLKNVRSMSLQKILVISVKESCEIVSILLRQKVQIISTSVNTSTRKYQVIFYVTF